MGGRAEGGEELAGEGGGVVFDAGEAEAGGQVRAALLAVAGIMGAGLPVLLWVILASTLLEEAMVDRQLRR